jgi:hypothetical protein
MQLCSARAEVAPNCSGNLGPLTRFSSRSRPEQVSHSAAPDGGSSNLPPHPKQPGAVATC